MSSGRRMSYLVVLWPKMGYFWVFQDLQKNFHGKIHELMIKCSCNKYPYMDFTWYGSLMKSSGWQKSCLVIFWAKMGYFWGFSGISRPPKIFHGKIHELIIDCSCTKYPYMDFTWYGCLITEFWPAKVISGCFLGKNGLFLDIFGYLKTYKKIFIEKFMNQ